MTLTERDNQVAKEEGVLLKTDGEYVNAKANETTGIEGITIMGTDVQRHGTIEGIFDLQGRKISNPTKGIYIKNNKKVVIK